jgi:hypothetical protein
MYPQYNDLTKKKKKQKTYLPPLMALHQVLDLTVY